MPQPAAPQSQRTRQAARTAAVAGVASTGAAALSPAPTAAGVLTADLAVAGILASFAAFLATLRQRHQAWLARELGRYSTSRDDIAETITQEMRLEDAFAKNAADRLAGKLPQTLRITDPAERERTLRQLLADEQRFAGQRAEAMAARAIAAVTRFDLRRSSPLGAFWRLGVAQKHTEGCVAPWMVVSGAGVRDMTRRRYVGALVEATTARGRVLAVTPNHPVLTARGWLPAHVLNEGDYLFHSFRSEASAGGDQQFEESPTVAEEVFGALAALAAFRVAEMPVRSEDFHGDGQHGHVDVVSADGALLDNAIPGLSQGVGNGALVVSDAALAELARKRGAAASGVGISALLANGAWRDPGAPESRSDPHARDAEFSGEGEHRLPILVAADQLGARGDGWGAFGACRGSEFAYGAQDRVGADAIAAAESDAALTVAIAPDEVVRVRRRPFVGHVFNLSTVGAWYTAEQLIVHNCKFMAGRFWPWAVLDRVAPPRHYGCTSSLRGYGEAILNGWMTPSDVPDTRQAVRDAAGVVMEQEEVDAVLAELDVRDLLLEQGVDTSAIPFAGVMVEAFDDARHPRGYHGRFRTVSVAAALLKRGEKAEIRPEHAPALIDELADGSKSSLHLLDVGGHPNLFRAHARELSRAQMPQIPKEHLPGFMDFLRSKRIGATVEEVAPSSLQATQNQINGGAVAALAKGWDPQKGSIMLISRDGHVLDGHHRWAAAALHEMTHAGYKVNALRFSAGTDRILALMREYNELAGVRARKFGEGRVPGVAA